MRIVNALLIAIALSLSTWLLGLGLCLPSLVMFPPSDQVSQMIEAFDDDLANRGQVLSLLGTVYHLAIEGDLFISAIIFLFSIAFPVGKLAVMWWFFLERSGIGASHRRLSFVEKLGKYSMLDVMVLGLIVVTLKSLPFGLQLHVSWGIYCFAGSIFLSMILPSWMKSATLRRR